MSDDHSTKPADSTPAALDPSESPEAPDQGESPELVALKQERDELYDRLLRKGAEFDNYRKRIERERREQTDQAIIDFLQALLLVVDDFDRALTAESGEDAAAYRKGVELIYGELQDLLRKYDVRPIEAIGTDFDPNVHQAVLREASEEHRDGEVIGELRRGYMIGERLLRPSMVRVATA